MAATIISETYAGVPQIGAALSKIQVAREFLPSSWTVLRIAARFWYTDSGVAPVAGSCFTFGLNAGGVNLPGSATTSHFLGYRNVSSAGIRNQTWTRAVSANNHKQIYATGYHAVKQVGNALSVLATGVAPVFCVMSGDGSGVHKYGTMILQYTRVSPLLMSINSWATATTNYTPVSDATWRAGIEVGAPASVLGTEGTDQGTSSSLTVSEQVDGAFTHVVIGWDQITPTINLNDLYVVKIS